jgi:hypothetical protein
MAGDSSIELLINLRDIYTEEIDGGKTIDTKKYKAVFKTEKTKTIFKQVALDMVKAEEISTLDYIKLAYPIIQIIGVTDRSAFDKFRASEKIAESYQVFSL